MVYFRLISTYFRLGAINELQYRANLWINVLQSFLGIATALGGLGVVFLHTDDLNGWSSYELLALVGIYFLMGGLIRTVIQPSMQAFLESVRKGTLDFILTKPEDAQLLVSIQRISVWSVFDIILGLSIASYAAGTLGFYGGLRQMIGFGIVLLCGVVTVYSFWMILATFAFWFIKVENILVIFQSMYQAGRWPVTIYPPFLRIALTFIVPVAFAVTVPAEALVGELTTGSLAVALVVAAGMAVIARLFWMFGIRYYSGASA